MLGVFVLMYRLILFFFFSKMKILNKINYQNQEKGLFFRSFVNSFVYLRNFSVIFQPIVGHFRQFIFVLFF